MSDKTNKSGVVGKFKATSAVQIVSKEKKIGHKCCAAANCNNRSENRPDLSFHAFPSDAQQLKKWEIRMKRGDAFFATVGNKFCCSEHFLPTDFKRSLTGHRRDLKPGSVPSVFPWTKVDEGSLCRAKRSKLRCEKSEGITRAESAHENKEQKGIAEAFRNDYVVFGPTTLDKWIDEIKMEHGRLLQELQEFKAKERISKFGLERFSGSDEDIKFYTGFPDYVTLLEFWIYVEPNASKLTYFSFVRDNTDSINFEDKFPFMAGKEKSFPGRNVGCARSLQPIDEFWLF